jgi:hypothetical protein
MTVVSPVVGTCPYRIRMARPVGKQFQRLVLPADEVCGWWKRDGPTVEPAFRQPGTEYGGHTPSKPRLTKADRQLFVWLYRLFPSVLNAVTIVQPETVIRWHRTGFRLHWRWKSRVRGGRPKITVEIRQLIREMSRLWGAPRIHGELLKLGIEVAQSTVAKYMARGGRGRSQTWKTFLHNHAAGIGAMDFLIVPTVGFRLLFVLVILSARTAPADLAERHRSSDSGVGRPSAHRCLPLG